MVQYSNCDTVAESCLKCGHAFDVNRMWWLVDSFRLAPVLPPSFFSHCQKVSHLLSTQCWELAASGWRLRWDFGNNCYSRLRMEMRMTSDWQNRLLGGLSYDTVSRSRHDEGKTSCDVAVRRRAECTVHPPAHYGCEKWLWWTCQCRWNHFRASPPGYV